MYGGLVIPIRNIVLLSSGSSAMRARKSVGKSVPISRPVMHRERGLTLHVVFPYKQRNNKKSRPHDHRP